MKFMHVAEIFLKIEAEPSRTAMTKMLAELFSETSPIDAEHIANLSLGQMRAPYRGTKFNFAQKGMEEVVAELLGISIKELRAYTVQTGDIGAVVAEMGKWKVADHLTVKEVFAELERFEALSGTGSVEEKAAALSKLLKSVDPLSACFIVRIVLQKLRLGFSEMTLIDAFSWMLVGDKSLRGQIEYAFNVSADIGYLARRLREDGVAALDQIDITVGIPIRPAAAERLPTASAIFKKLGACVAQPKYDGFRVQVHLKKGRGHRPELHFFSRNLLDMTGMFPDLAKELLDVSIKNVVVEGEAISYDPETGTYRPFQETVKRKRKYDIAEVAEEYPLRLILFDLLFCDDVSYLDEPEEKRFQELKKIFGQNRVATVTVTEQRVIEDAEALENYFSEAISIGLEGLVVKRPDAPYQPGKRNFNWIKLKRAQRGELADTIDVVILGYYYGRGKRASLGIGAFLVGVYNSDEDRFETIAKIGTGLTDDGWRDLKKRCDERHIINGPHNVIVAKELVPDKWVAPEIVVMVKADEITRSPLHTAGKTQKELGFALRFPRFIEYRSDKSSTEATGVDEIKSLFHEQRLLSEEG
ncbi:MAG: ATP-dependent DNA ligase [Candidatus Babeliaceae bacterium]|nr:ATP-dependent DNA ligase [Candidatus Babeliaceae bacterium]